MTLEELRDWIKTSTEHVGQTLKPEEDWLPFCFLIDPHGTEQLTGIPATFLGGPVQAKGLQALGSLIKECDPEWVVILSTAWFKAYRGPKAFEEEQADTKLVGSSQNVKDRPGTVEALCATIKGRSGEEALLLARIVRSKHGSPELEWDDEAAPGYLAGSIIEALRAGYSLEG